MFAAPLELLQISERWSAWFARAVFLLGVLLPGTLPRAHAESTDFVHAYDSRFEYQGRAYRFIGFNLRNLINYGAWDPGGVSRPADIDTNLQAISAMGGRVVRCFVALNNSTTQTQISRLKNVLDKMQSLNLKAIVVLTDLYSEPWAPFHPAGDDPYYQDIDGYTILNDAWFTGGYQNNYQPFCEALVNAFRDHPAIFAWEIGNELKDAQNPPNIIPFVHAMAASIKQLDSNHMVTTGFLSWDHQGLEDSDGLALYQDPNLDFMTVHSYDLSTANENDTIYCRLGKPLILEEFGLSSSARLQPTHNALDLYFNQKQAQGFMQWGFQAQDHDIGDGDNVYGVDPYVHGADYQAITALYANWASTETRRNEILPRPRPAVQGVNIASGADATADSALDGAPPAYAIDGVVSPGSKWTSQPTDPPHWLALDLGRTVRVDGFKVKMAGLDELTIFSFQEFQIQFAPSAGGPWTTLTTVENPAQFAEQDVILPNPQSMRYVRLWVTGTGVDTYARLPEFEVYEAPNRAKTWAVYR